MPREAAFGASRIEFTKYKPRFGGPGAQTEEERRRRNLTMDDVLAASAAFAQTGGASLGGRVTAKVDGDVVLDNGELGKISREQISAIRPVWQTGLVNPDFAAYADICGGVGFRVATREELAPTFDAALQVEGRPSLVAIRSSAQAV